MSDVSIAAEVLDERTRQDEKWGEQNHPNGTGPDVVIIGRTSEGITAGTFAALAKHTTDQGLKEGTVTFLDILLEEVMEAAAESDPARLRVELVQVAAVAQQWVEKIDRDTHRQEESA